MLTDLDVQFTGPYSDRTVAAKDLKDNWENPFLMKSITSKDKRDIGIGCPSRKQHKVTRRESEKTYKKKKKEEQI